MGIVNYTEENFQAAENRAISLIDEMLPNGPLGIKHAKIVQTKKSKQTVQTSLMWYQ